MSRLPPWATHDVRAPADPRKAARLHALHPVRDAARAQGQAHSSLLARGTTHLEMSPLEFMERPAALLPRLRLHRIRLHGALSAIAKLRANVTKRIADRSASCATWPRSVDAAAAAWDEVPADIVCS